MNYEKYLGKKYKHGGRGPEFYDCYGLIKEVYNERGITLPDIFEEDNKDNLHKAIMNGIEFCEELEKPEPFCLVAIALVPGWVTHVGIVLNDRRSFMHIMKESQVTIEKLDSLLWKRRVKGFYRWKTTN